MGKVYWKSIDGERGMKGITGIGYEYFHPLLCFTPKWECIKYRAKIEIRFNEKKSKICSMLFSFVKVQFRQ